MGSWLEEAKVVDTAVYAAVAGTETPRLDVAMRRLSGAADQSKIWFAGAALLALGGGPGGRRAARRGVASLALASGFANLVAKPLTTRRRPDREELEVLARRHVPMPRSSSFPSGHTASAFAFATGAGQALPGALGAAAGAGDAGRLLARPYRCPLSRRRPGRRFHRRQRRRGRRPPARQTIGAFVHPPWRNAPRAQAPSSASPRTSGRTIATAFGRRPRCTAPRSKGEAASVASVSRLQ